MDGSRVSPAFLASRSERIRRISGCANWHIRRSRACVLTRAAAGSADVSWETGLDAAPVRRKPDAWHANAPPRQQRPLAHAPARGRTPDRRPRRTLRARAATWVSPPSTRKYLCKCSVGSASRGDRQALGRTQSPKTSLRVAASISLSGREETPWDSALAHPGSLVAGMHPFGLRAGLRSGLGVRECSRDQRGRA